MGYDFRRAAARGANDSISEAVRFSAGRFVGLVSKKKLDRAHLVFLHLKPAFLRWAAAVNARSLSSRSPRRRRRRRSHRGRAGTSKSATIFSQEVAPYGARLARGKVHSCESLRAARLSARVRAFECINGDGGARASARTCRDPRRFFSFYTTGRVAQRAVSTKRRHARPLAAPVACSRGVSSLPERDARTQVFSSIMRGLFSR